jgi:hypothetical protein
VQRIMALGDSHGNLSFMRRAIELAVQHECDVVHVVGDFGFWTHVPAGVTFLNELDLLAQAASTSLMKPFTVTFTDGNHESFDHLYAIPVDDDGWRRVRANIWHAPRGHIWRWGEVNFMSMGGAHSIDGPGGIWAPARGPVFSRSIMDDDVDLGNWWPQETITDNEVQTAIQNMTDWPSIDVLFAHDAPTSISLPHSGYPAGDKNRARLQEVYEVARPQLLVHGHYHMFQQFNDLRNECLSVGLAHDMSKEGGQYMFIDTDPFNVVVPTWG